MENIGKEISKMMNEKNINDQYKKLISETLQNEEVKEFIKANRSNLTDDDIIKSYSKIYEFVQEKKKFIENADNMILPGYEPKLFLNFHYIDVAYIPTKELIEKNKANEIYNRVTTINMSSDIRKAELKLFDFTNERKEAINAALKFINNYSSKPNEFHKGLYLQGSFGVGKTFLLGSIANELAKNGFQTIIVHFPTLNVEIKNSIGKETIIRQKMDQLKKAPILMIDDIGADSMSSWVRDDFLGIILQYRMQEQLTTFFSSNFSMKKLEEEHLRVTQRGENEPLKAKRIMERIMFLSKEIKVIGENRRH